MEVGFVDMNVRICRLKFCRASVPLVFTASSSPLQAADAMVERRSGINTLLINSVKCGWSVVTVMLLNSLLLGQSYASILSGSARLPELEVIRIGLPSVAPST